MFLAKLGDQTCTDLCTTGPERTFHVNPSAAAQLEVADIRTDLGYGVPMNLEKTQSSVQRFRNFMEHCHEQLGPTFENFPRGCCGDVTELLAAYLKDEGLGEFAYVSGWSAEKNSSHAWLEKDGYIIDATADQFQDRANCSMVIEDRKWHGRFADCPERRDDGDFRLLEGTEHLCELYDQLKKYCERST
jgi:hypothetical protein